MEWVYIIDNALGSVWQSGKSRIMVDGESRQFYVVGYWENKFPTFHEAAAWCEEQDRLAAQPEIQMPKKGDVWGVPAKPETRRFVVDVIDGWVYWLAATLYEIQSYNSVTWQSWVRETGAVDLLADREALAAEVREFKESWSSLEEAYINKQTELAARVKELEASRDRLADGLRKIESLWCHHASHLVQDILTKEGLSS